MYYTVRKFAFDCTQLFDTITAERKEVLKDLTEYIESKYKKGEPIKLNFICTHNSRRSQFGQIAAALAANYYCIDQVFTYSGGTEATRMNENAINAVKKIGLVIESDEDAMNPNYTIRYGVNDHVHCFSKIYTHPTNPQSNFAALMTCVEADGACPIVLGAEKRISLPYIDPKKSDSTGNEEIVYFHRFQQICTELFYAFSNIQ